MGIVVLLLATSAAVLVFFVGQRRAGTLRVGAERALLAPALGLLGLLGVFI